MDLEGIGVLVVLTTRPPHRGPTRGIEYFEHDSGSIGGKSHQTTKRIDLTDDLAFAKSSDRGVAGHGADRDGSIVTNATRASGPRTPAAAQAASVPACPPPITMTSK